MDHARQKKESINDSLTKAGIGSAFHSRSLTEFDPVLVEWVNNSRALVSEGQGLSLIGDYNAYQATILLARAMHLKGYHSLVVPLRTLVKWLEYDAEELKQVMSVRALFITRFYDMHPGAKEPPMKPWEVQDVEGLIFERMDNSKAVFTQSGLQIVKESWWTPAMVDRLLSVNKKILVR